MYLLDTDICSYFMRERPVSVLDEFKRVEHTGICISVITQAELLYGIERYSSKKMNRTLLEDFFRRVGIKEWTSAAADEYGVMRADLEKRGKPIGNMDMLIAAHALSLNATLVTNNGRHFSRVPRLKTLNWV